MCPLAYEPSTRVKTTLTLCSTGFRTRASGLKARDSITRVVEHVQQEAERTPDSTPEPKKTKKVPLMNRGFAKDNIPNIANMGLKPLALSPVHPRLVERCYA
jgi:hypothetical protein